MGYLVVKDDKGNTTKFSSTCYTNLTNGTKYLCIKTGTGANDIAKYGLTTNTSASEYCKLHLKVGDKVAYIARKEGERATVYEGKVTNAVNQVANGAGWRSTSCSGYCGGDNQTTACAPGCYNACTASLAAWANNYDGVGYANYNAYNIKAIKATSATISYNSTNNPRATSQACASRVANYATHSAGQVNIVVDGQLKYGYTVTVTANYSYRTYRTTYSYISITKQWVSEQKNNQNI